MTEQVLTLRPKGKPLILETPSGLVIIHRDAKDIRKLRLELPPGIKAYLGDEKLFRDPEYIEKKNGKLVPKHAMLVPMYEGEDFVGYGTPGVINLEVK